MLGGGKFANGAQTAAIQYLFNQIGEASKARRGQRALLRANPELQKANLEALNEYSGYVGDAAVAITLVCPQCAPVTLPVGLAAKGIQLTTDLALQDYESFKSGSVGAAVEVAVGAGVRQIPFVKRIPESYRENVVEQALAAPQTVSNLIKYSNQAANGY